MNTLITYEKNYKTFNTACATKRGRRIALLQAFKANQFKVANPTAVRGPFMDADMDAFNMPQDVFDNLGAGLKKLIGEKRNRVGMYMARMQKNFDTAVLRDELLGMPVEEAVEYQIVVDGKKVYAVDVIAPVLNDLYKDATSDGYTHRELFEEFPLKFAE